MVSRLCGSDAHCTEDLARSGSPLVSSETGRAVLFGAGT